MSDKQRDQIITATQFPVIQDVQARPVRATAYLVIELPNHEAYPDGKGAVIKRATELAAEGKMPVRWVDPLNSSKLPTDSYKDYVAGLPARFWQTKDGWEMEIAGKRYVPGDSDRPWESEWTTDSTPNPNSEAKVKGKK